MIVFIYIFAFFLIIVSIIVLILFSISISIQIEDIRINDVENFIKILNEYKKKKFEKIFDYISFKVVITVKLFKMFNILIIKLDNKKIKRVVIKIMLKELKIKLKLVNNNNNNEKYKRKIKLQKKIISKIKPKILRCIKIKDLDLILCLGLVEADMTALLVGLLNIIISYIYSCYSFYYENYSKIELENICYKINPVYSNDLIFYMDSRIDLSINLYKIII